MAAEFCNGKNQHFFGKFLFINNAIILVGGGGQNPGNMDKIIYGQPPTEKKS